METATRVTRIKFARLMQSQHKTPERRIYQHEYDTASIESKITNDDSTIVHNIWQVLAHAATTKAHSSTSSVTPPISKFQNLPPSSLKTTTPSTKSAMKSTSKTTALRSSMDPAHPASLLATKPIELYDKVGTYYGHVNPKLINLNLHRWYTNDDEIKDSKTNEQTITTDYNVSASHAAKQIPQSLIDRGANGGVAGSDCRWMGERVTPRNVSITGIDNHQLTNIPVGTVGAYAISNRGPVICIFNKMAYMARNCSILSSFQLEHHGNIVDDKHPALRGKGTISTPDGYIFPLSFTAGLAYINMRSFTDEEYV